MLCIALHLFFMGQGGRCFDPFSAATLFTYCWYYKASVWRKPVWCPFRYVKCFFLLKNITPIFSQKTALFWQNEALSLWPNIFWLFDSVKLLQEVQTGLSFHYPRSSQPFSDHVPIQHSHRCPCTLKFLMTKCLNKIMEIHRIFNKTFGYL